VVRVVLDATVMIDHINGRVPEATALIRDLVARDDELWSSYVVRTEVLAGMRRGEERQTEALLNLITWSEVGRRESDAAGAIGRRFVSANRGIDMSDLILAELALHLGAPLLTANVKHFPMFPGLKAPYSYS